jgi:hypothetical protein
MKKPRSEKLESKRTKLPQYHLPELRGRRKHEILGKLLLYSEKN